MVDKYGDFLVERFDQCLKSNQQLTTQVALLKAEKDTFNDELDLLRRKCLLYRKERDCYRNFIYSYESEINGDKYFGLTKNEFTTLDGNLAHYSSLTETLNQKLTEQGQALLKIQKNCEGLERENERLKGDLIASSEKEKEYVLQLDQMKEKCNQLTEQLKLSEDREPPAALADDQWRIIHLIDNPVDNRINSDWSHYQFLKEENERLQKRLEIIQAGHDDDITRLVNEEVNYSAEIQNLKMALKTSETKRAKMLEEWRRSSKDLREACLSVTGYRIEVLSDKVYKVFFHYSENPSDYFLFKLENNDVRLLETDYSRRWIHLIKLYLEKHDSYPAFLAAITLELFKKSNQC